MTAVLEVNELYVEADIADVPVGESVTLVRNVSFEVAAGEMVGLAGESGSGKSLTASAISGLIPTGARQSGGSITVMGQPVSRNSEHRIAMIFQNPMTSLNPSLRIGDQIAEAARIAIPGMSRSAARRRAVEILDQVEVPHPADRAKQYPYEFSGGMRQRAMIGIAIARQPTVLIADEPTTALDVTVQKGVMDLIDRLRVDMNLAVLLISHDLGVISQRCDRLMVMYAGELVETGFTRPVLDKPLHPYVDGLLACIPERAMRHGGLRPLPGQVPAPDVLVSGCRFADRCAMVIDQCRVRPILLESAGDRHSVRCIRWSERAAQYAEGAL